MKTNHWHENHPTLKILLKVGADSLVSHKYREKLKAIIRGKRQSGETFSEAEAIDTAESAWVSVWDETHGKAVIPSLRQRIHEAPLEWTRPDAFSRIRAFFAISHVSKSEKDILRRMQGQRAPDSHWWALPAFETPDNWPVKYPRILQIMTWIRRKQHLRRLRQLS